MPDISADNEKAASDRREYVVVARRYRPQRFDELIGQEHVARALGSAISTQRVGHAYLFTGARGVGKTSAARIFAKALNCQRGPSPVPCNECDICSSIAAGSDVDVVEIDGASNRNIDDIRELRQNVGVRPSRSRFKIYIIDEVHMLTKESFNALLKTLEEPPEHVKFIFATTDPNKIPITILSRCQRFDFGGIDAAAIEGRLSQIASAEGVEIDAEAVQTIARRAAGSMRDSQSLLEQLLALGRPQITAADVDELLGTAPAARLSQLVVALANHDAAAALKELDDALAQGTETGQLLDQLLGYFRDVMAAAVGCKSEAFLNVTPGQTEEVADLAQRLGVNTVLAIVQILEEAAGRLRNSFHARTLAEMALVRIAALENLDELSDLIAAARRGELTARLGADRSADGPRPPAQSTPAARPSGGTAAKPSPIASPPSVANSSDASSKKNGRAEPDEPVTMPRLTAESAQGCWAEAVGQVSGLLGNQAARAFRVDLSGPNHLVVGFGAKYHSCKQFCENADQRAALEAAVSAAAGDCVRLSFVTIDEPQADANPGAPPKIVTRQGLEAEVQQRPVVRRAMEVFKVRQVRVEVPGDSRSAAFG